MARFHGVRFVLSAAVLLGTLAFSAIRAEAAPGLIIHPTYLALNVGQSTTFTVKAEDGTTPEVTWEAQGGTVDATGVFKAPDTPGNCTITARAGGVAVQAQVLVVGPPKGPITAPDPVYQGARGLKASVPDQFGSIYEWRVEGGTIQGDANSASMIFDVGDGAVMILSCRIVNAAGRALRTSLEIPLVSSKVTLSVVPKTYSMNVGTSPTFGFSLEGGKSGELDWSVLEPGGGTVDRTADGSGAYHAPDVPGTYTLQVASHDDPTVKDTSTIKVLPVPTGAISGPFRITPKEKGLKASVPAQAGMSYLWKITNGTITEGETTPAITFDAGEEKTLQLECTIYIVGGDSLRLTLDITLAQD